MILPCLDKYLKFQSKIFKRYLLTNKEVKTETWLANSIKEYFTQILLGLIIVRPDRQLKSSSSRRFAHIVHVRITRSYIYGLTVSVPGSSFLVEKIVMGRIAFMGRRGIQAYGRRSHFLLLPSARKRKVNLELWTSNS